MINGKWAVTNASSQPAEALLEQMANAGIASQDVVLLDHEQHVGNRLAFAETYIEILDQTEFDYEGLTAVLLLKRDAELESLLDHADCYVVSHYFDENAMPIYSPALTKDYDWRQQQNIKLANAEFSSLLSILNPLQSDKLINSIYLTNIQTVSFYGKPAIDELASQTISLLNTQKPENTLFPLQLAFNMQPIETPVAMEQQLSKLIGENTSCAIQTLLVPAFHGFAVSVMLELDSEIDLDELTTQIKKIPGIKLSTKPVSPMSHCQKDSTVYISSLRLSQSDSRRVQFWMIADSAKNGLLHNYINTISSLS